MKRVILFIFALAIYVTLFAKPVTLKSKDITELRTETINGNARYYVILKDGKKYELHTATQLRAIAVLSQSKQTITVETKSK